MIYTIETGHSPEELSRTVNIMLENGWKLVGGVTVTINTATSAGLLAEVKKDVLVSATEYGNNLVFFQAMSK